MARGKKEDKTATSGKAMTVVVSRSVFPGREHDYDEWVKKLADAAKESPGNTGVTILVPSKGQTGLHHVVMHFADEKSMHQWETSYLRQKLSHEADAFSRRVRQEATGLETWFSIPECPELEAPPKWKMTIVTTFAVFLASIAYIPLLELFWKNPNFFLFNLVVGTLVVSSLTYFLMPIFSRYVFRKWLYK
jgi:antibiotic biosynthesis monooxygenase (ABM) superfamily enzyme